MNIHLLYQLTTVIHPGDDIPRQERKVLGGGAHSDDYQISYRGQGASSRYNIRLVPEIDHFP